MRALVLAAVVGWAGVAGADSVVEKPFCEGSVFFPPDGMTNFPVDARPRVLQDEAGGCRVSFVDDLGRAVAFTRGADDASFLEPVLEPGRRYTLELLDPDGASALECDGVERRVTFETRPAPHVREVTFAVVGGTAVEATVDFSEDVRDAADLQTDHGFVAGAPVDGNAFVTRAEAEEPHRVRLVGRSDVHRGFRLHVSKGLRFASGASMEMDFDQTIVPADVPFGWRAGDPMPACPEPVDDGCAQVPAGLLALLIATRARRRPTRR